MAQSTNSPDDLLVRVPASLCSDDVLAALADPVRRLLLEHLQRLETPERLTAVTRLLAVETDHSGEEAVERLHVHLHHVHVPKLADAELVSHDGQTDMMELTEAGQTVAETLAE